MSDKLFPSLGPQVPGNRGTPQRLILSMALHNQPFPKGMFHKRRFSKRRFRKRRFPNWQFAGAHFDVHFALDLMEPGMCDNPNLASLEIEGPKLSDIFCRDLLLLLLSLGLLIRKHLPKQGWNLHQRGPSVLSFTTTDRVTLFEL